MDKAEIEHLGELSRIALTETEINQLSAEIPKILDYVSAVNNIAADDVTTKQVGARYNVLREDVVTNEPGSYTPEIINEMPATDGKYLKVKKILQQD